MGDEPLRGLGAFSVVNLIGRSEQFTQEVRPLVGGLTAPKAKVASYLRGGHMAAAWMEHTRDLLGGESGQKFGVPDGSAEITDGTYIWRADTAEYVEHYSVALPEAFLAHAEALDWTPPLRSDERKREIELEMRRR